MECIGHEFECTSPSQRKHNVKPEVRSLLCEYPSFLTKQENSPGFSRAFDWACVGGRLCVWVHVDMCLGLVSSPTLMRSYLNEVSAAFLSPSLLWSFIPSDGPYECIWFYPAQCCMHHSATMKPKRPPPLLFLQSTAYLNGRVCSSEGTWGDSGWGRRTIHREDALRRFLSWRWRDICFSFLRPSHSLVLWHYVFRRGHCSCLHGKAEDVGLCTCFLCLK